MSNLLEVKGVSKQFPGVIALNDVSIELKHGEVHCLIGENGAGKSTLIKILMGIEKADKGELNFEEHRVEIHNTVDALNLGIAFVPQELTLMPDMTVGENILMGRMPKNRRFGLSTVDYKKLKELAKDFAERVGLNISVDKKVGDLEPADMQLCQIARALSTGARVIILDEPTASLGVKETERLFEIIKKLCAEGVAFIYVTHRLDEIPVIGDRITVLRDGTLVGTYPVSELTKNQLIQKMVGSKASGLYQKKSVNKGNVSLRVENLTKDGAFTDISFDVNQGEIVGIFGLVGAKRTDVLRSIMGLERIDKGRIEVFGQELKKIQPQELKKLGVAYIPEERRGQALALKQSLLYNFSMASINTLSRTGLMNLRQEALVVQGLMGNLGIKSNRNAPVENLSGGNQQKVVIGRWLMAKSKLFLIDEPTRGIDVGARSEIYNLMENITVNGGSVVMVSSDLEEVLSVCDRILVMKHGTLVGHFSREEATAEKVTSSAFG